MADSSAGQGYNFTNAPEVFDIGIRSVPQKRHNRAQHSALERKELTSLERHVTDSPVRRRCPILGFVLFGKTVAAGCNSLPGPRNAHRWRSAVRFNERARSVQFRDSFRFEKGRTGCNACPAPRKAIGWRRTVRTQSQPRVHLTIVILVTGGRR
jgi:hypothetical protein